MQNSDREFSHGLDLRNNQINGLAHLRLFFNITTQTEFEPKLCKQIFSVTSVHYFFLNGICLNHKKTFEICTTNMANMHAYMSTLGPSKYKYE